MQNGFKALIFKRQKQGGQNAKRTADKVFYPDFHKRKIPYDVKTVNIPPAYGISKAQTVPTVRTVRLASRILFIISAFYFTRSGHFQRFVQYGYFGNTCIGCERFIYFVNNIAYGIVYGVCRIVGTADKV